MGRVWHLKVKMKKKIERPSGTETGPNPSQDKNDVEAVNSCWKMSRKARHTLRSRDLIVSGPIQAQNRPGDDNDELSLRDVSHLLGHLTQVVEGTAHQVQTLENELEVKNREIQKLHLVVQELSKQRETEFKEIKRLTSSVPLEPLAEFGQTLSTTEHRLNQVMTSQANLETRVGDIESSLRDLIVVLQNKANLKDLDVLSKQMVLEDELNDSLSNMVSRSQLSDVLQHYVSRSQLNPEEIHSQFERVSNELDARPTSEQLSSLTSIVDDIVTKDYLDSVLAVSADKEAERLSLLLGEQVSSQRDTEEAVSRAKTQIEQINNRLTEYGQQTNLKIQSLSMTLSQVVTQSDSLETQLMHNQTDMQTFTTRTQEVLAEITRSVDERLQATLHDVTSRPSSQSIQTPSRTGKLSQRKDEMTGVEVQDVFKQLEFLRLAKDTHDKNLETLRNGLEETRRNAEENSVRRSNDLRKELDAVKAKQAVILKEMEVKAPLSALRELLSIVDSLDKKTARQLKSLTPSTQRKMPTVQTAQSRRTSQPNQRESVLETPFSHTGAKRQDQQDWKATDPILNPPQALQQNLGNERNDGVQQDLFTLQDRIFEIEDRLNNTSIHISQIDTLLAQVGKDVAQSASSLLTVAERQTKLREEQEIMTLDIVKKEKTISELEQAVSELREDVNADGARLDDVENRCGENETRLAEMGERWAEIEKHEESLQSPPTTNQNDTRYVTSSSLHPQIETSASPMLLQRTNVPQDKNSQNNRLTSSEIRKQPIDVVIDAERSPPHPSAPHPIQSSPSRQNPTILRKHDFSTASPSHNRERMEVMFADRTQIPSGPSTISSLPPVSTHSSSTSRRTRTTNLDGYADGEGERGGGLVTAPRLVSISEGVPTMPNRADAKGRSSQSFDRIDELLRGLNLVDG
ncbi:hypothetical protein BLNAU_20659 [Blattamonas nauphoetae]|uniref:Uncharacterized protein n=1 Tax=Blattamonas nauphoetae TaxID=2049346 RepID=A0ABQ9WY08_9EUKA|nr:hypothetical protein BLNAU_20659 [Blattamonas nauphoetae]